MCNVRWEGPSACEAKIEHVEQLRSAVQRQNINNILLDIDPESVRSYRCSDTEQSNALRAVFDWAILITEVLRSGAERNDRKISKLLNCNNRDLETIRNNMKCVIPCSDLVREISSGILEKEAVLRKEVRTEGIESACESTLYRKKVMSC